MDADLPEGNDADELNGSKVIMLYTINTFEFFNFRNKIHAYLWKDQLVLSSFPLCIDMSLV